MTGAGAGTPVAGPVVAVADQVAAAGWLGSCYPERVGNRAGGWCDGNGPDWTYRGVVHCTNGGTYYGVERWAGDRRASAISCPRGKAFVWGGVYYYNLGYYRGSALV